MEDNSKKTILKNLKFINLSQKQESKHLKPLKHPQQDFFIADIFDAVSLQLDQASMEYPLFALKARDNRERNYEQNGLKIKIAPNHSYGMATIHDKDIWIYCISKIMQAKREGQPVSRIVHFTIYDYLKTTNRGIGGREYNLAKDSLDRLASTRITTEIETDKIKEARGFGLVDSWRIVEEKDGRMIRVSVTLPDWLYRSIESKSLLTISPDYFRLRKPLDRRIYELARKHCGNNKSWPFNLKTLYERSGSSTNIYEFRRAIKSLAESNELPDYNVYFDDKRNQVTFVKKVSLKELAEEIKTEVKEVVKPKRKKISQREAEQMARVGEEWQELLRRIGKEYQVIFDKKD